MSLRDHPLCASREPWPFAFWGPEPLDLDAWKAFAAHLDVSEEAALISNFIEGADAVLDVGGGLGTITQELRRVGTRRVLLDPMITRTDCLQASDGAVIHLVSGRAEELPFGARTFDAVLATWVLQYTHDPARAVREMARVASLTGKVLIVQAHPENAVVASYNACARIAGLPVAHHGFLLSLAADLLTSSGLGAIELHRAPAVLRFGDSGVWDADQVARTIVGLHFSHSPEQSSMRLAVADILREQSDSGLLRDDGVLLVAHRPALQET